MKRIILFGAGTLVVFFALFAFRRCGGDGATDYQTTTITRGAITQAVTATGTLNPVVNVQVGSQISGNIQKLFVDFNSPVKAGQIVAEIDPAVFQAAVLQAQGDLANAKAALELAQITAEANRRPGRETELRASRSRPGQGRPCTRRRPM